MLSSLRAIRTWLRESAARWLAVARLMPLAGPRALAGALLANIALGLLPIAFVICTSTMIGRIYLSAEAGGRAGWGPVLAAGGLAGAALLLQNVLAPFQLALGELVARRVDRHCIQRFMRAAVADVPLPQLEDQNTLSLVNDARNGLIQYWQTPGSAAAGLLAVAARYTQALGAVTMIGILLGFPAAVILAVTMMTGRLGFRVTLSRYSEFWSGQNDGRRRMEYVLATGISPGVGKDMRVLGILGWFGARAQRECDTYWLPLWRERLRMYFVPFIGYSAALLAGLTALLLIFRSAVLGGSVSTSGLALAIQAVLLAVPFAAFFPEADIATQWGMQTHGAIRAVARRFGDGTARTAPTPAGLRPLDAVRFEKVSFAYPGSTRLVLDKLDLEVRVGESTAIVGLNGAGKTTVVKLLSRLYQPDSGRILLDDTDLAEADARAWQRQMAVIFQDYIRYELDARANVTLGAERRSGDEAAFRRACERAGASDIIAALPHGQRTVLSGSYREGTDLSGGQWQRVALARALFAVEAGASILVLDEPTAQLDVRAEAAFYDSFLELTRGLTTVVISHRFSAVRRADRIVVLADGRVAEEGQHDALIEAGGRYAELFALQASRFTAERSRGTTGGGEP